jgi:hypothetical protein
MNTQFTLEIDPSAVYHRQDDVSNPPPYQTTIKGSLFLASDPSPRVQALLTLAGCKVPPNKGPLKDKTIAWELDAVAQQHGHLSSSDPKTKEDGTARAVYETISETTPKAGRIPAALQTVQGEIQASVLDLVDGHENLAAILRLVGSTEKAGWVYPDIKYYGDLALDISGSFQLPGRDATVSDVIAPLTIPLTPGANGTLQGIATVPLTSSATFNCGSGGTVQAKGAFTGKFTVLLTPSGSADSGQLKMSFIPDLSMLKAPVANTMCTAGDLNDVAWAGIATLLSAKGTFGPTELTYTFTPPAATGSVTFTLHPVK